MKEIEALYVEMDGITRAVDRAGLSEREREYLRLRYFQGLKNVEIERKMNYSNRQIKRISSVLKLKIKE